MCGIAGVINIRIDSAHLEYTSTSTRVLSMLKSIRHRGPDEIGVDSFPDACIGNVRLKIVGEKAGKQPVMKHGCGLVFNGEIYNYQTLAEEYCPDSTSDTEVLFAALSKDGPKVLNLLNGVFSFCFIDEEAIYLGRDRFGEKPLYYTINNDEMLFASELKAFIPFIGYVLQLPGLYAALETPIREETVFKNVFQVDPGSYIRIDRKSKKRTTHRYYSYTITPFTGTLKEQIQEVRRLALDAIALRIPSNLPYGAYISGGIDSSVVALTAKPSVLLTYLPGDTNVASEEHYADMVAAALPDSTYIKITPPKRDILLDVIRVIYCNDGPTTTLAAYSQYVSSEVAHNQGLRVMLSGMGVDEFFSGYVRQAIGYLPPDLLSEKLRTDFQGLVAHGTAGAPTDKAAIYAHLVNRSGAANATLEANIRAIFAEAHDPVAAMNLVDMFYSLPPLMTMDDHISMAFGVENRSPFLDHRLVELALSLPAASKIHGKQEELSLKYVFKEAFKDILPPEIFNRKDKVGFFSHLNMLLRGEWRPLVERSITLLQEAYPDESYYEARLDPLGKFGRHDYQIFQLAITHLLFCEKLSPEAVAERLLQS